PRDIRLGRLATLRLLVDIRRMHLEREADALEHLAPAWRRRRQQQRKGHWVGGVILVIAVVSKFSSTEMPSTNRSLPFFWASVHCIITVPSPPTTSLTSVPSPSMQMSTVFGSLFGSLSQNASRPSPSTSISGVRQPAYFFWTLSLALGSASSGPSRFA